MITKEMMKKALAPVRHNSRWFLLTYIDRSSGSEVKKRRYGTIDRWDEETGSGFWMEFDFETERLKPLAEHLRIYLEDILDEELHSVSTPEMYAGRDNCF